jgi:anaerobic magnesium-protoporphyrin IX monomethyl ester cyclase
MAGAEASTQLSREFCMEKRVTLVNGAWFAQGEDNLEDLNDRHPLGLLYLASTLREKGYMIDYRDFRAAPSSPDPLGDPGILAGLMENSSPVLGISCLSHHLPMVISSLEIFKEQNSRSTVILGGLGPAGSPVELLETFPFIDIIVEGEGEGTLCSVLEHLGNDSLREVRGISFRRGSEIMRTPPAERIADIDSLPFPAYDLVDLSITHRTNIITSRGCPLSCTFCSASMFWARSTTRRGIASIIDEISSLYHSRNVRRFRIDDDLFVNRRERVIEFCDALQSHGLAIDWGCYGRVDRMDPELLERMSRAGCSEIYFGVESGSNEVLRRINKGFTIEAALDSIRLTARFIPKITCFFIWGFPFEHWDDFLKTLNAMVYLREKLGVILQYRFLVPYPTIPLYEEFKDGIRFSEEVLAFSDYRFSIREHLKPLIQAHPRLFSVFHYIEGPDIEKKHRLIKRIFP